MQSFMRGLVIARSTATRQSSWLGRPGRRGRPRADNQFRGARDGEDVFCQIPAPQQQGIAKAAAVLSTRHVKFTLPNVLTISRVPMMFIVVALMYTDWDGAATWAFWLYIASALTDWLDGLLARRANQVSSFGRFMDATLDKVMVTGLMIALVNGGYFEGFRITAMMLLLLIVGREFAISGLRMAAATKGLVVEADASGKVKTFVQMNAIGWLLGARMFERDYGHLFGGSEDTIVRVIHGGGLVLYVLAAVLTVTSGIAYFRKHGHVVKD
jgi:CDP-diacylglycerol--glycerol-3-phosphate 3-phosphatidyltransferase